MKRRQTTLIIVLLLTTGVVQSDSEHRLTSHVQAAAVEIKPLAPGRRLVALPELEFPLRIEAGCFGEARAESLSISVADTVETHDVSTLDTDLTNNIVLETRFRVPRGQVAPIAIEHFCTNDNERINAARNLLVPAVTSANISLRCATDNAQSVRYASVSLEIRLVCMSSDDISDVPKGQGPSAPNRRL
jgi:hypothetical protein